MESHSFNVVCATRWGVGAAVMLHHLTYWVMKNAANGKHMHEGRAYTYNTYHAFTTLHPYWNKDQVGRLLRKLEQQDLIASAQLDAANWNRTKWYTICTAVREVYGLPPTDTEWHKSAQWKVRKRTIENAEPHALHSTVIKQQLKETPVVLPWDDEAFVAAWQTWKDERKARGTKKYTHRGEQSALKQLQKDSNNLPHIAVAIIEQSIAHGWQGLFPLKQPAKGKRQPGAGIDVDHLRNWAAGG